MYSKITNDIEVTVEPTYLEAHSAPEDSSYVWAYQVRIQNRGAETVQLRTRTWHIIDARGRTQVVHGAGVVGEEPVLGPGDWFEYVSGTPLSTPSGLMNGSYSMQRGDGSLFEVAIPPFSLDSPHDRVLAN